MWIWKLKNFSRYLRTKIISDKTFAQRKYVKQFGEKMDFNNPKSFNQKINVMSLSDECYQLEPYVDKYLVRDFVSKTIGEQYLIKLICASEKFDKELFDSLPKQFILKTVNGSNTHYICRNKSDEDYDKIKKLLGKWYSLNPYLRSREKQYRYIQSKFVVEELMVNEDGSLPIDYKFHCFNGKIKFILGVTDRFTNDYKVTTFDENGNALPVDYIKKRDPEYKKIDIDLEKFKPIVEKLAEKFRFVRVDLYQYKGQIKFGELTFTPMNATGEFNPMSYDYEFGKLLDISQDSSFFVR